eukprot:2855428-Pleurochrysis_carterae.AAC.4
MRACECEGARRCSRAHARAPCSRPRIVLCGVSGVHGQAADIWPELRQERPARRRTHRDLVSE